MGYSLSHLQPKSDWVQMQSYKNEHGPNQLWSNAVNAVSKSFVLGTATVRDDRLEFRGLAGRNSCRFCGQWTPTVFLPRHSPECQPPPFLIALAGYRKTRLIRKYGYNLPYSVGARITLGCSKRLSSKAADESKPEAYPQGYVEDFDELRTKLADFFSVLLSPLLG